MNLLLLLLVAGSVPEQEYLPEGPWGTVQIVPMQIRLSEQLVPERPLPMQPWIFRAGRAEVQEMVLGAGVESPLADELLKTYDEAQGGLLRPPADAIRRLSSAARGRLYETLRHIPGNRALRSPYKFSRAKMDVRFRELRPETRALLEELFYERDSAPGSRLLADLPALTRLIEDGDERVRLIQAASVQDSLMLRLRIDESTDAAALAAYWGRGGRRRDLEILLSSLKSFEGGYDLDVIYLLPAFARAFLFTYPIPENAAQRDCFWTALNFFLPAPDDSLDGPALRQMMLERYEPVEGPPQLGDILVLWRPSGEAEHAAIFIAGDVYFTKNGGNLAVPWLLMRRDDLFERYDDARPSRAHYRRKNAS